MNTVRLAVAEDAIALAPNLRQQDLAEICSLTSAPPVDVLLASVGASVKCYTWTNEGRVVALFGVAPTEFAEIGAVWMVASPELVVEKDFMFTFGTQFIDEFNAMYPVLENYILPSNDICMKWLDRMGFVFDDPAPIGPFDTNFTRFTRVLPCA